MNRYITCIDVETTGLDKRNDYIIQLALLKFDKVTYEEVARYSWYIIPQHKWSISKGAQDAHGLSEEFIKENGTTIQEIGQTVIKLLEDSDILTYNGNNFDIAFLYKDFKLAGYEFPIEGKMFYDSMSMEVRMNPRNLGSVYRKYTGKEIENAHDALADVMATVEVFKHQQNIITNNLNENADEYNENKLLAPEGFLRDAAQPGDPRRIVFGVGKYKDSEFMEICKTDPDYIKWYMENVASDYTKKMLKAYYAEHR